MNYQEAKQVRDQIEAEVDAASEVLNQFPKNPMGMTPDDVKESPEYMSAKRDFNHAFRRLQTHNSYVVKTFKKEMKEERRNRR